MVTGSCLCGGVSWAVAGELTDMFHCHCSMCRKSHGAAYATYVGSSAAGFEYTGGEDRIERFESSPGWSRSFCSRCGSVTAEDVEDDRVYMPAGCLDGDPGTRPTAHIFVAHKAPWHEINDDLPRFDAFPPGDRGSVFSLSPRPRATETEGAVVGSCLCGHVGFEMLERAKAIVNCHCSRCRKARAAAHASNIILSASSFRWLQGEGDVLRYRVPQAQRFAQYFCGTCGSSMPHVRSDIAVIPAGALDDDPGARARLHIHIASKASWHEISDDLPRHRVGSGSG